ncbi:glycoside hydrolase family 2 protein [Anaerocolumna jejuensis]|uniref:glycoside hydrolase family 2 protein n=1 Tax=Anaerocolumna jejuensis TaxID=259063 RepID=UPI003F7B7455
MNNIPRNEYPRPNFIRDSWLSLNGTWDFSFDREAYDRKITVPFAYETKLSGINETEMHKEVWYRRKFMLPEAMLNKQILLHFGAVDYSCRIWVNDIPVTEHTGGQTGFFIDITACVRYQEENVIRVQVRDDYSDLEMPRGKQYWEEESKSIFYTRTTGIWQSVWIEAVSQNHLKKVFITPLLDEQAVRFEYYLAGSTDLSLDTRISFNGTYVTGCRIEPRAMKGSFTLELNQPALKSWNFVEDLTWSPENPRLFDVIFTLSKDEVMEDTVRSYFGMRKISIDNGIILLNNRPYYQKLLLDQGYWPDSLLTAPEDEAFVRDIKLIKEMGFNGVRKHQKVEDPRFLYHADVMGLLVWGEIGSAYLYSRDYAAGMYTEWSEAVLRDYNHPSIVAWTPLNESWGIHDIKTNKLQQGHSNAMLHITKSLDETRIVIDDDGWEHTEGDLLTIHDYEASKEVLKKRYSCIDTILEFTPSGRALYVSGWSYRNQPIIVSECGGIDFRKDEVKGWGYSSAVTGEEFLKRYEDIVAALMNSELVQGFCYTQLTDVEQETNGLLNYDRSPKVPLEKIREINEGNFRR